MPGISTNEMDLAPFRSTTDSVGDGVKHEMIKLEQRMTAMLNSRHLPSFFKTPDEINADFYKKSATIKPGYINYSDTLDGCMNIQQSLIESKGYMEENY